ncbi:MAG: hypothetical protein IJH34_08805 [Romboutsia sp.]|nr:hypothetical protein [Romboutsia sp.]
MLVQLQVLNYIISHRDFSIVINNNLDASFFSNFSAEFKFLYEHYKQYGQTPDIETFLKAFPDFEVLQVNESTDYLLSELYKEKNQTFLVTTFNQVKDLLMSGNTDKALDKFLAASQKVSSGKKLDAVDILEDISRYDDYVDKCNNFSKYYLSTGFRELDNIIGGFDRQEELAVIAARSGEGKSWLLTKFVAEAVKQGLTVGLFSGEMSVNKVAYRFDTLMSHISNGQLVHGNISAANDYMSYLKNLKENHSGNLYVMTRDMVDGKCGVNALRSFVEKYNLDILFIDQLSLLDDDRNGRAIFEQASNITKDLKILQTQKHIPIISVSQQNREKIEEGEFAGTQNISNSDRIAQDATLILFLSRKDDILTVYIGKGRDGGTGEILKYNIDLDKGKYEYIREDVGEAEDEYYEDYDTQGEYF